MRRTGLLLALTVMIATTAGATALAHPLGNFTINHLARISVHNNTLQVDYVLDIAEIPTFQIMQNQHATNSRTDFNALQWAQSERQIVEQGLNVTVDGSPIIFASGPASARLRPGAGGLPILYWTDRMTAPLLAGSSHHIVVNDRVYSDRRIGWKDIVFGNESEPTHALRKYPSALIGSPRRIASASFTAMPNGIISQISRHEDTSAMIVSGGSLSQEMLLSDMFSRPNQTPLFVMLTILVAFGLGALHAVEPGHGKALLAVTLVGSRATFKQAAILAASVTFAHTIGVILLGVALLWAANLVSETIFPWITLLSGFVVAIIGARALANYLRRYTHGHTHGAAHTHTHTSDHHHDDDAIEHGHSHAVPGTEPIKFSNAIWAAMSGGIAPCPAAIVVLLAALHLHQLGYGLLLIVVFSFGLAGVLIGLGFAVVRGAAWLSGHSRFETISRIGPLVSASLISIIGAVMVGQGFVQQGVHASLIVISAIVLAAIVGYVFTSFHSHREVPA